VSTTNDARQIVADVLLLRGDPGRGSFRIVTAPAEKLLPASRLEAARRYAALVPPSTTSDNDHVAVAAVAAELVRLARASGETLRVETGHHCPTVHT